MEKMHRVMFTVYSPESERLLLEAVGRIVTNPLAITTAKSEGPTTLSFFVTDEEMDCITGMLGGYLGQEPEETVIDWDEEFKSLQEEEADG